MAHVPLCSVQGCPHPSDPAFHLCAVCHHPAVDHQHTPKRSLAGKDAKILVCLCRRHHALIDSHVWSEIVYNHPNGEVRYNVKNERGEDRCDKVIGRWQDANAHETPLEPPDTSYGPAPAVAQDWPVTREPHGHLKGKALPAAVSPAFVRYERRALVIEGTLSWERYEELCATLETMEEAVGFWIGDLIVRGEQEFGERCYQPWTAKGYKAERLRQYAWVAQQIPAVTRVTLSWTHHRAVAALPPGEQAEWLTRAQEEGMSSRQLRECVTVRREPEGCAHEYVCRLCGKERA